MMLFWPKKQASISPPHWHSRSAKACLDDLHSSKQGLDHLDASKRLKDVGKNKVRRIKHFETISIFIRQFQDLLVVLLMLTAGLSWYLKDSRTTTVLIAIIAINVLIGFTQEYRADRVMQSLGRLLQPTAKVIRSGVPMQIDAQDLVPGDIVMMEAGDSVPADLRLLLADSLLTNEYALTGESSPSACSIEPIGKDVELADRNNMVYMGTTVASGVGRGVVVATGMKTELGTIAKLSQEAKPDRSPLQKEISNLALRITQGTIILMAVLIPISLGAQLGLREAFLFAIGIAAAMIPQGLPAEVNVALAQAAGKLAKSRVLVRRLTAAETLGSTQIICTDKTGTLTKNEMTVTNLFSLGANYRIEGTGFMPHGRVLNSEGFKLDQSELMALKPLIECGFMSSNASVHEPDSEHPTWYSIGDPTEAALVTLAQKAKFIKPGTVPQNIREFPFDSDRKMMSVVARHFGQKYVFAKGSPEAIVRSCSRIVHEGHVIPIKKDHLKKIQAYTDEMSSQAMRNIALAYRPIKGEVPKSADQSESGLVFLGIASMIDPPREEVAEAMLAANRAHMVVTIVTGDEAHTASAIAQQIGFAQGQRHILTTHNQLARLSDKKVSKLVMTGRAIFARVSPSDKLRIVNILKKYNYTLAVTGDGINDAPALKRADIGVAMGRVGSDVAKDSAEIILLDDSFHTLVEAIKQGRVIYQNIQKSALSALTTNGGELAVVLISLFFTWLFHIPIAISALQILAIDLMAELFPITALGWDPPTGNVMDGKPRDAKQHILGIRVIVDLILGGIVIGALAYGCFLITFAIAGQPVSSANLGLASKATTATYLSIVLCSYGTVFSRRTAPGQTIFTRYIFSNWRLWFAIGLSLFCVLVVIYVPLFANYLGNSPLAPIDWVAPISAAIIYLTLRELAKYKWRSNQTQS